MSTHDNRVDDALSKFLEDRNEIQSDLESFIPTLRSLDTLRDTPPREENAELAGRQAFLEFAKSMPIPVSQKPKHRLYRWKTFFGRERRPMTTIVSIALALILAFGGAGTTAYAAQDSLPTEFLYPVKEFTEQIQLTLTTDPEAEVQLLLDFTQERLREMVSLVKSGSVVPEETQQRFQEQLQTALAKAAQLGDPELAGVLQRIQTMAQSQIQTMQKAQENMPTDTPCEAIQLAIQAMNRVKNEAEDGLVDPITFRLRQGTNRPEDAPEQPDMEPQGPGGDSEPNSGDGNQGQGDGAGDGGGSNGNGAGDGSGNQNGESGKEGTGEKGNGTGGN